MVTLGRMTILVTGATGNVGRQVVAQLPGPVRALSRTPFGFPPDVGTVRGDLAVPATLAAALKGVEAVFLMWPLHTGSALPAVLDLLRRRVRRVVFLGSGGVADLTMDEQEALVAASGLEWTVIRPGTFAANALWWTKQIRSGNVVRGAHGTLALPMLHEADIAAVAVQALTTSHAGRTYHLTGPELLTQAQQVRIIGEAIGRPLHWEELSRPEARRQLLTDDFPESFVDVLLDTYATMSTTPPPKITTTVAEVTGRPASTFRQWAQDHSGDFTP